jgi:hypothetical protein
MNARIAAELELLRRHYDHAEHAEVGGLHWFRVGPIRTPEHWSPNAVTAAFSVTQGHPGAQPYGFYVPVELTFKGTPPSEHSAPHQPPFPGKWRFLSWNPEGWQPTADLATGANLWGWVRSFVQRLREGA